MKPSAAPSHVLENPTPSRLSPLSIVLFGPPGVGKTSTGLALAARLGRKFVDTDDLVKERAGVPVNALLERHGEVVLRRLEQDICAELEGQAGLVIACGGGTLLEQVNRTALEAAGVVVTLEADPTTLRRRIEQSGERPLLGQNGDSGLGKLLEERQQAYEASPIRIPTDDVSIVGVTDRVLEALVRNMDYRRPVTEHTPYPIHLGHGLRETMAASITEINRSRKLVVVSDENVGTLHAAGLSDILEVPLITIPAGETSKSLDGLQSLYDAFVDHGLDRHSAVVAVGGGVVTDLAGFAAATFMRGIRWAAAPTTLLGIVDASLGGKVGINMPQAKNLIGAFHSPFAVWADLDALDTLPERAFRAGLAEIVKSSVIGDADLFRLLERRSSLPNARWLEKAIAVKMQAVEGDPRDRGPRQVLNFGHTIGHALESASRYDLTHGEAISIGMVVETRLAERMSLANEGLSERIARVLNRLGLPTRAEGIDPERVWNSLQRDKKRSQGNVGFALPRRIGDVAVELTVPSAILLDELADRRESV
jgi:shikimate kinase / 3-dehydroquinate synthase